MLSWTIESELEFIGIFLCFFFVMVTCHIFNYLNFLTHINTRTPFATNALSFDPLWNYIFDFIFFILRVLFFAFFLFFFFFLFEYFHLLFRLLSSHHNNTLARSVTFVRSFIRICQIRKILFLALFRCWISILLSFPPQLNDLLCVFFSDLLSLTNGGSVHSLVPCELSVCQRLYGCVIVCVGVWMLCALARIQPKCIQFWWMKSTFPFFASNMTDEEVTNN